MRHRAWVVGILLAGLLLSLSALGWAESTVDASDWLLSQQLPSGGFPWTAGGSETTNTQGPSGNGLLAAAGHTGMLIYLDAALATGDYLVPVYTRYYGDGDPRFATYDPLFLEMLSLGTSDSTYSGFVQTYFWDYLAAGTYGESNDMDALDFGMSVVTLRASQGIVELSPWDIAGTAVGAQMAGEPGAAAALMQGILAGLEATTVAGGYDVVGLAGAVWASGITGIDLDPTAGVYAAAASTADLAAILATMTLTGNDGAWLYDSTLDPTDVANADTQTTAFALLAFQAFDSASYAGQIGRGVAFIRSLQHTDGQFLAYPTAAPDTAGSVEVNAESLLAIALTASENVVVDEDFTGMALGDDPDGGDPLIAIGYDAFARINAGIDAVKLGGTVYVMGKDYYFSGLGEYDENVLIYKSLTLDGISWPAVNPSSGAAILLRSPGGTPLADVTISGIDSFTGSYGLLIDEAMWAHLSEELVVENLTYDGASWLHDHSKEGIAILHGATVNGFLMSSVSLENNLNGLGISGAGTEVHDLTMQHDTLIYNSNHGMYVYSGPILTDLSVSQSTFESNTHQGLHLQNATLDGAFITESSFSYNGGFGMWFQGANCSGLVIVDTLIEGNDSSGLALHSGLFSDVLIERSTFRDNAWEHLDLGLWGGVATLSNVRVLGNVFETGREWAAIYVDPAASFGPDDVQVHYNVFTLGDWAIGNSNGSTVDASLNWWGSSDGPAGGAPFWGPVIYSPWLGINPDGDPGTVGVQLISPMLFVVDDVGLPPAGGYLDTAIVASNDPTGSDVIEVRPGTYCVDEPITDGVAILSTDGACATTIGGQIDIGTAGVLLGEMRSGFRIDADVRVLSGKDASLSALHWNDIYGMVENAGLGTLDATYNFWGAGGAFAQTIGSVDVWPYLPLSSCLIIGYIDDYGMTVEEALVFGGLIADGYPEGWAKTVTEIVMLCGITEEEALALIFEYNHGRVKAALRRADDCAEFYELLEGYVMPAGGGGAAPESVAAGEPLNVALLIVDPITGDAVTDALVTVTVCRDGASPMEIVYFALLIHDEETGMYQLAIDTTGWEPGTYRIYIGTDRMTWSEDVVEVTAP